MNKRKKASKHIKLKFSYIRYTIITLFLCLLFVEGYVPLRNRQQLLSCNSEWSAGWLRLL